MSAPRFATGSTFRHVSVMTATGAVGLMAIFAVDALNLFYISLLGEKELAAAVGFAGAVQFFTVSVGIGLSIAAAAVVSRAIGAGRREEARRLAGSSLALTLVALTATSALAWGLRAEAVAALGARGETAALAARFLSVVLPGLPLLGVGMACASFMRAVGDARRAMMVTLAGAAAAVLLDPLFIFGFGLGLDGAASATVAGRFAVAGAGLHGAIRVHRLIAGPTLADAARDARPILAIAGPAVATQLSTPTGTAVLTGAVASFGDAAVAGWAVVARLAAVAFGGLFALSGAVGPIFGQNVGAKRPDRVRMAYRDSLLFCALYVAAAAAALYAAKPWIVAGFGLTGAGAAVAEAFLTWGAAFYLFTGWLFVSNAAFNNLGRPLWSTALNWTRDAAVVPLFALALPPLIGVEGVVAAQAGAALLVGCLAARIGWRRCLPLAERATGHAPASGPAPALGSGRAAAAAAFAGFGEEDEPRDGQSAPIALEPPGAPLARGEPRR